MSLSSQCELDANIDASNTPQGRLALPETVFSVDVVIALETVSGMTPPLVSSLDVKIHATTDDQTKRGAIRTNKQVTTDGAQIIPEVVASEPQIKYELGNTGRDHLVL